MFEEALLPLMTSVVFLCGAHHLLVGEGELVCCLKAAQWYPTLPNLSPKHCEFLSLAAADACRSCCRVGLVAGTCGREQSVMEQGTDLCDVCRVTTCRVDEERVTLSRQYPEETSL